MPRPSETRRALKWAALAVSLLIAAGWAVSLVGADLWRTRESVLYLDRGGIACLTARGLLLPWQDETKAPHVVLRPRMAGRGDWIVPLWIPFVLIAIPTATLWWTDRRYPPGACQRCGYDLTGNVSGICPECGTRR